MPVYRPHLLVLMMLIWCQKFTEGNELEGTQVNVSVYGLPPYVLPSLQEGVDLEIMKIIAKKMDFSITFVPNNDWGRPDPKTGVWDGVLGEVKKACL